MKLPFVLLKYKLVTSFSCWVAAPELGIPTGQQIVLLNQLSTISNSLFSYPLSAYDLTLRDDIYD